MKAVLTTASAAVFLAGMAHAKIPDFSQLDSNSDGQLTMQELKNTAADLALAAAGRLLHTAMTSEDHRRLVTEFLEHFPERIEG